MHRPHISVANRQKLARVDPAAVRRLGTYFGEKLSARTRCGWTDISIVLVDDVGIRRINLEWLGRDEPTDVISFRFEPTPCDENMRSGEIVVNVQRAIADARRPNTPRRTDLGRASRELALYLAHGFDHLSGADDNDAAARRRMLRREWRWLAAARATCAPSRLLTSLHAQATRKKAPQ